MAVTTERQALAQPEGEGSALRRRMAFIVILSSAFLTSLVYSVVQPILPVLAANFGGGQAGEHFAQLAATTPAIGMLVGGLIGGWLIALVGKRPVILAALVAMGILGVAEAFLSDPKTFLADRVALGLGASLMATACVTLLGDLFEGEARDRAVGLLQGMATFGAVPTVLAVGFLAAILGWRAPFGFFAVFAIPVLVLALLSIDRGGGVRTEAGEAGQGLAGGVSAMRLWPIFLFTFAQSVLNTMGVAQIPFLLKQGGVVASTTQGLILSSNALAMGIGAVGAAKLQARLGTGKALLSALLVAGVGNVVVGLSPNVWLAAAGSVFSYLGLGVLLAMVYMLVLDRATPEERPVAVGYAHVFMFIGQFANPLIMAPFNAAFGQHATYAGLGVISLAAVVIGWIVSRGASRPAAA
jgi:MFS family permease